MDRYAVLRKPDILRDLSDDGGMVRTRSFPSATTKSMRHEQRATPTLDVHELDDKQLAEARSDPQNEVAAIMPTTLVRPVAASASDGVGDDWGLRATNAFDSHFDGERAVVAILDTGIDRSHCAFAGMELVEADFTKPGGRREGTGVAADGDGHGTHAAGTIFGRDCPGATDGSKIRIGVAPGVRKALIGKVLDDSGSGDSAMIYDAILWANSHQEGVVDVISMSLGFDFAKTVLWYENKGWPKELAISKGLVAFRDTLRLFDALMDSVEAKATFDDGLIIVAASGNESMAAVKPTYRVAASLPASAKNVISVGALDRTDGGLYKVAPFSNTFCTVSAPGVAIRSAAKGGGLSLKNGTSMACPHVAGIAALWWDKLRQESPDGKTSARKVMNRLMGTLRTTVFAQGVGVEDRGDGLVTAP